MAGIDPLAAIGQKLTAALTSAYASANSNAALVFLPGGVTVPADLVQQGIVNPAQMQTFLEANFDSPFVISPSESAVHGKDETYGTSSEIYVIAASSAQPLGSPTDAGWKRVASEIAVAQSNLTATNMQGGFACEPDDWVLPSNTSYWTQFDSTQDQPAPPPTQTPTPTPLPLPIVNPRIWMMRPLAVAPAVKPQVAAPRALPHPPPIAPARTVAPNLIREMPIAMHPVSTTPQPPSVAPPPQSPPAPTSTINVQLQHQCVTLGYMQGGVSWWDGAFLGETGWYIPGMARGGLLPLPPPEAGSTDLAYGLPVALIVVQGLTLSGSWTNEVPTTLGSLGPFSLQGATTTAGNNGTVTYSRPGMQVIALLCSQLPILPPVDDPGPAQAAATTPSTAPAPAATPNTTTSSVSTPPPATTPPAAAATPGTATPSSGSAPPPATSSGATAAAPTPPTAAASSAPPAPAANPPATSGTGSAGNS
jgi:hypothetical protein